jgi:3'-phosphoadenosine 5'-phosphosulfate sulfotransferase (PAPS reductase)/FAD synthetase
MKVIVQFSGGKDSLASLIWAIEKYGVNKVEAVFCDTKWEHELTYKHIEEVTKNLGVKLVTLTNEKVDGFLGLVKKKKRFPSTKARFCTEHLKTIPAIDYILKQEDHLIIIQGIRKDESLSRSLMAKQCTYFKFYTQPYGKDKKGKDKFHTYRKKDIKAWREKYSDDIIRPFFDSTGQEVIDYILSAGYKPNPLYYMGMGRVGCMPCIMAKHSEIKEISIRFPEHIDKIRKAEKELKTSIFTNGKIPDRCCSKTVINKKGVSRKFPTIDDVVNYVTKDKDQLDAFKEPGSGHSCMSFYGICE